MQKNRERFSKWPPEMAETVVELRQKLNFVRFQRKLIFR